MSCCVRAWSQRSADTPPPCLAAATPLLAHLDHLLLSRRVVCSRGAVASWPWVALLRALVCAALNPRPAGHGVRGRHACPLR